MRKHLHLATLIVLIAFLFSFTTVVFAHVSTGSHQHKPGDPENVTFTDFWNDVCELFAPITKPIMSGIAVLQHLTYVEPTTPTPYYTVSDIGGGFYRCSCGVSYSYYDSHSH